MPTPRLVRLLVLGCLTLAAGIVLAPAGPFRDGATEGAPRDGPEPGGAAPSEGGTTRSSRPCPAGAYLCADLDGSGRIVMRRWTQRPATLVIHVPPPTFEPAPVAAGLQAAAAAGLRAWNGQPFPIRVETRDGAAAHFAVRWTRTLGGSAVGVARTRWSEATGLGVDVLELATRDPFAPDRILDPERVRLTAAHEMGHALGLPHSDSERDVMFPRNTASALTARDYRSMEALYALPDGTVLEP